MISKRIDFAIVITAANCNPNGNPTNGNRPRQDMDGYGEISDVCLKHKIRERLFEHGENILYKESTYDSNSIKAQLEKVEGVAKLLYSDNSDNLKKKICETWFDARAFGAVIGLKSSKGTENKSNNGVSIGIRGPITIGIARSLDSVDIKDIQIAKCLNTMEVGKKDSSTVGMKSVIGHGAYVAYGSINQFAANKTGFTDIDTEKVKYAMADLFENDASAARPSGSMTSTVYWWEQSSHSVSPATVHRSLNISPIPEFPYFKCNPKKLDNVSLEILGEFSE